MNDSQPQHPLNNLDGLTFAIDQRHIDQGVRKDPELCPLAQAMKELLPPGLTPTLHVQTPRSFLTHQGLDYKIVHHPAVAAWIRQFDRHDNKTRSRPISLKVAQHTNPSGRPRFRLEPTDPKLAVMPQTTAPKNARESTIMECLNQGMTVRETARKVGLTPARISQISQAFHRRANTV